MPSSADDSWFDKFSSRLREHRSTGGLARYELKERIGQGGAAEVFAARDRELGRPVAIKLLHESLATGQVRERFLREAKISAGIPHPNIVSVYDTGEDNGRLFIVMELLDGRSLADRLAERTYDLRAMVRILVKVSAAVAAAHQLGIVHRDLKPGNILLTAEGEPKVADFGLAHVAGGDAALTRTGTVMGTPLYMAPEQVQGRADQVSPRTDVYALGAILYEMMAGRPPHIGESVTEIYDHIMNVEAAPPRRFNAKAPGELEIIALKALEKEPGRRYASAAEFGEDLRRHLDGEAILARPPGLVSRSAKWVRRHRLPSAAAAMAVAAVLLVAVVISLQRRQSVAALMDRAVAARDQWRRERAALETLRRREADLMETIGPFDGREQKAPLWKVQHQIELKRRGIRGLFNDAVLAAEAAREVDPAGRARRSLAELHYEDFERACAEGDAESSEHDAQMVRFYDDGTLTPKLAREGAIVLDATPEGAVAELFRYEEAENLKLAPVPTQRRDRLPLRWSPVPAGSYLVILSLEGYPDVRYPVLVEHGKTHEGKVRFRRSAEIGPGFVFVPAGPFIEGGDPEADALIPRKQAVLGDYFIDRNEATIGAYLEFINAVLREQGVAAARDVVPLDKLRRPWEIPDGVGKMDLPHDLDGRWAVTGITWTQVVKYCEWRTREARARGDAVTIRLPSDAEWEKAARGVDGRAYPWGNRFDWSHAGGVSEMNNLVPDPEGAFLEESPFGVCNMAGGMQEWCADVSNPKLNFRSIRGGGFGIKIAAGFRCGFHMGAVPDSSNPYRGFRVVRIPDDTH